VKAGQLSIDESVQEIVQHLVEKVSHRFNTLPCIICLNPVLVLIKLSESVIKFMPMLKIEHILTVKV